MVLKREIQITISWVCFLVLFATIVLLGSNFNKRPVEQNGLLTHSMENVQQRVDKVALSTKEEIIILKQQLSYNVSKACEHEHLANFFRSEIKFTEDRIKELELSTLENENGKSNNRNK